MRVHVSVLPIHIEPTSQTVPFVTKTKISNCNTIKHKDLSIGGVNIGTISIPTQIGGKIQWEYYFLVSIKAFFF